MRTDSDKADKGGDESKRSAPHKETAVSAQLDCDEEVEACSEREAGIRKVQGEVQISAEKCEQEGSRAVQNTGDRGEQSHEDKDQIVQRYAGKYIEVENSEKDEKDIKRSEKNARDIRVLRNKTEPC